MSQHGVTNKTLLWRGRAQTEERNASSGCLRRFVSLGRPASPFRTQYLDSPFLAQPTCAQRFASTKNKKLFSPAEPSDKALTFLSLTLSMASIC
ncbi:unnamed protein product [Leptosia nina]|uniref:Uncharacterized protein n=1 Tax=Leptosia nina TaxID=320188 RepID=A0AAV1JWI9_9NEOP